MLPRLMIKINGKLQQPNLGRMKIIQTSGMKVCATLLHVKSTKQDKNMLSCLLRLRKYSLSSQRWLMQISATATRPVTEMRFVIILNILLRMFVYIICVYTHMSDIHIYFPLLFLYQVLHYKLR